MTERLLITGATGFLGTWTIRHWKMNHPDVELWTTSNQPPTDEMNIDRFFQVDLCDNEAIKNMVHTCQPIQVIHLAGTIGFGSLENHLRVNVLGSQNLYDSLASADQADKLRIIQASSAATYGLIRSEELPVNEEQPYRPISAYALSKLTQDYLALAMWWTKGLKIVCARIFNILGPGQPDSLVPMTFIKQLLKVRASLQDRLKVGNTVPRRDFIDVRDVVSAFDSLMQHGRPGEIYNVASGTDVSIKKVIDEILRIGGLEVPIETASERVRSTDVERVQADISKITTETGWRPKIPLCESLEAMWYDANDISDTG